jgi:hypothetical protein
MIADNLDPTERHALRDWYPASRTVTDLINRSSRLASTAMCWGTKHVKCERVATSKHRQHTCVLTRFLRPRQRHSCLVAEAGRKDSL